MRALLISLLAVAAVAAQAPTTPGLRTMRVDYFHTGDAKQEIFSFDEAVIEPAVWSGRAGGEMDQLNYGGLRFRRARRGVEGAAVLARLRLDLRRMVHDRRSHEDDTDLPRVGALFRCRRPPSR
jgi:hypothetical protein